MPALIVLFALAGFAPFSILIVSTARGAIRRLREPRGAGGSAAISQLMLALLSAIDTGFVALALRSAVLPLHPPG
ncbi:MAG TPA: hypothetical protein VKV26_17255 [Dehalococcoidia bacterium]|nr:hypothetical protein [Dehalococcoidia bacterium]